MTIIQAYNYTLLQEKDTSEGRSSWEENEQNTTFWMKVSQTPILSFFIPIIKNMSESTLSKNPKIIFIYSKY